MSGRHRTRSSRSNLLIGSIAASVGVSGVLSAAIVELVSGEQSTAPPPAQERSVTQEGRLIAVTADSLTAQSPDGQIRTYAITPSTTGITRAGGQMLSTATPFAVNDEVSIIGTQRGDAVVATAVAEKAVTDGAGPPMDYGV